MGTEIRTTPSHGAMPSAECGPGRDAGRRERGPHTFFSLKSAQRDTPATFTTCARHLLPHVSSLAAACTSPLGPGRQIR